MDSTVYFPCACLYTFHCLLSLCMPLCMSLPALLHASMHLPQYLPYACLYAFHCLLSLRMPRRIPQPTFPPHDSMHLPQHLPYACLYAYHLRFHCALSQCMPRCISLPTFPMQLSCSERNDFTRRKWTNAWDTVWNCWELTLTMFRIIEVGNLWSESSQTGFSNARPLWCIFVAGGEGKTLPLANPRQVLHKSTTCDLEKGEG